MPITLSALNRQFQEQHHGPMQDWLDERENQLPNGQTFDQAQVRGGLHQSSYSPMLDPNPTPHYTVRLTDSHLRARQDWYTLHWHPVGISTICPMSEAEYRAQEGRQKAGKRKDDRRGGGGRGGKNRRAVVD